MAGLASPDFRHRLAAATPGHHPRATDRELVQILINLGFLLALCLIGVVIGAASAYS